MRDRKMSPSQRLVFIALSHFVDESGKGAHPGISRLCWMTGLQRRSVQRIIRSLERDGLIEMKAIPGHPNQYRIKASLNLDGTIEGRHTVAPGGDTESQGGRHNDAGGATYSRLIIPNDHSHRSKNRVSKKSSGQERTETDPLSRYNGSGELIQRTLEAISKTRKTGKIDPSVRLRVLTSFDGYPAAAVLEGCQIYLSKYAAQGKREEYLVGIIQERARKLEQKAANQPKAGEDPKWKWD